MTWIKTDSTNASSSSITMYLTVLWESSEVNDRHANSISSATCAFLFHLFHVRPIRSTRSRPRGVGSTRAGRLQPAQEYAQRNPKRVASRSRNRAAVWAPRVPIAAPTAQQDAISEMCRRLRHAPAVARAAAASALAPERDQEYLAVWDHQAPAASLMARSREILRRPGTAGCGRSATFKSEPERFIGDGRRSTPSRHTQDLKADTQLAS